MNPYRGGTHEAASKFHSGRYFVVLGSQAVESQSAMPWRVRAVRGLLRLTPRGRYTLLGTIAPNRGRFIGQLAGDIGGARFHCDLHDLLAREACFTGMYEPPVTRVFQHYARKGAAVVDVGANWGYFTLVAASAVGSTGSVAAFEPDPRQFAALSRNLALNGFGYVTARQAAVSDAAGRVTLRGYTDRDENRGISRIGAAADAPAERQFDVETVALDDRIDRAPIDLVKIDVEGAEDLVLEGMRRGLAAHRYRALILELHPGLLRARGVDPDACVRTLLDHGYRGRVIDASPGPYRRALNPGVPLEELLLPLERWRDSPWPHLLWLC
jgi:FkbM family methyltransferase